MYIEDLLQHGAQEQIGQLKLMCHFELRIKGNQDLWFEISRARRLFTWRQENSYLINTLSIFVFNVFINLVGHFY